jgi:Xaa-Pro aminopeptidase
MGMGGAGLVAIGSVSYTEGVRIAQALAGVEIVDISVPFGLEILPKSAEELKLIRHTAQAGERAAEALLAECRVGACESDLFAAVINALAREGGDTTTLNMLFTVKPDEVGFVGGPGWFFPMRPPQVLEKGDFVRTEIFANYGGMVCQTHPSISIGEPSAVHRKISEVARRAYEAGLKQIRPGVAFSSVWKAMRQVVLDAGCWASSPLLHSLSPTLLVGELSAGLMEADVDAAIKEPPAPAPRDAILKEGMVLAVEPSAGLGYKNAMVGSTVIVTKDGAEALNSLGTRLLIAKA